MVNVIPARNFELDLWASLFFPQPGAREKSPVVCPCEKKNTAKGKEAFQGKFVVIVEGFAR